MDDDTFHASTVKATTKAEVKKAEKTITERLKAEAPEPLPVFDPSALAAMNLFWRNQREAKAEAVRQSTMQIPSQVVIPHAATGAVSKPKGSKKRPAEGGDGSASASKKAKGKRS